MGGEGPGVEIRILGTFTPELAGLLAHKPGKWAWQLQQRSSQVDTRFYVVRQEGRLVANVMLARRGPVAILGHVFTLPECRGQGHASALVDAALADFRGHAVYLATEFDSAPFRLYARRGFVATEPGSGHMAWFRHGQTAFESWAFAPAAVSIAEFSFAHWPVLPALTCVSSPSRVRLPGMAVLGPRTSESGSLDLLTDSERRAVVALSGHSGLVVAIAALMPDPLFGEQVDVLDLFAAPGHEGALEPLVTALRLDPRRTQICYSDGLAPAGFERVARLSRHLLYGDVDLWQRVPPAQ